jgi:hypothetical protein
MPITGDDQALMYALGGVARGGATRGGYHTKDVFVSIAGVQYATGRTNQNQKVVASTLTIHDERNDTPNTASCEVVGFVPSVGDEVIVTLGSQNNPRRWFAGHVIAVEGSFYGKTTNGTHALSMVDYTWGLNKRQVRQRWTATSASDIARDIIETYCSGYTAYGVASDLDVLEEFSATHEDVSSVLSRLANRIGGYWFVDYRKDVHLFVETDENDGTNPEPLESGLSSFVQNPAISVRRDLSQVATRVKFEGGGGNALETIEAGETILPVSTAEWYPDTGGYVVSGTNELTFTGVDLGGGGTLVGPGAAPSAAPTATAASGSGIESGTHEYAVTYVTASGESLPGPRASVTLGFTDAPASAAAAATTAGTGPDAGTHYYAVTFVTGSGETTSSPVSNTVTTRQIANAAAPTLNAGPNSTVGDLVSGNQYAYAYAYGLASSSSDHTKDTELVTGNITAATATTSTSNPSKASQMTVTMQYSTDPAVTWVHLYRRDNTLQGANHSSFRLVASYANLRTGGAFAVQDGAYTPDILSNHQPTAANNAHVRTVALTNIPIGSAAVTSRKVYRTAAGGSQLKLLATIANNTATTYTDTTADASLGVNIPTSNTTSAAQVSLTGIPVGGSTVTGRKVYRTTVGGSQLKLVTTLSDNTTTTYTDSTADVSLGAEAPAGDTSGIDQPAGQVVAGSTTMTLAGTGSFPSAGWAIVGQQLIRYTGTTSSSLTGIPASGVGSIAATVLYGTTAIAAPQLTGIPASGAGAVVDAILKGDGVNLLVVDDDTEAQAVLAALVDGDGVQETYEQDRRVSYDEAVTRAAAVLALRKSPDVSIRYRSTDWHRVAGRTVSVDLDAPIYLTGDLVIQRVTVTDFLNGPFHDIEAGTARYSFEDLVRQGRA